MRVTRKNSRVTVYQKFDQRNVYVEVSITKTHKFHYNVFSKSLTEAMKFRERILNAFIHKNNIRIEEDENYYRLYAEVKTIESYDDTPVIMCYDFHTEKLNLETAELLWDTICNEEFPPFDIIERIYK